jgi:hypothetical protein
MRRKETKWKLQKNILLQIGHPGEPNLHAR